MANEGNLIPLNKRTKAEQQKISSKGGKASSEARRKRKTLHEAYLAIAGKPYIPVGSMAESIVENFGTVTIDEAIMLAMAVKASNGDVSAASYIRDTIGEKWVDKKEVDIKGVDSISVNFISCEGE